MPINSYYDKIVTLSPHVEMSVRRLYYRYEHLLKRFNKRSPAKPATPLTVAADFNQLVDTLVKQLQPGQDVVIVHSAFSALKQYGLSADEMLQRLLEALGADVTIAMPAIPIYPNEISKTSLSETELIAALYTYKVESTRIWTGALAQAMIRHTDSHRSLHPLNTLTAIGPKAELMMRDNLLSPMPCGEHSAWNYCMQQNALVVGLGCDLTHSLTMLHVAEDSWPESWPVADWYMDRTFQVSSAEQSLQVHIKERRHVWGKLHFAERNLARNLMRSNILSSTNVDNVVVEFLRASPLIEHLRSHKAKGYPYYWLPKSKHP